VRAAMGESVAVGNVQVGTDVVNVDSLRISGNPAQRIIDGCLRNISPEDTLAQMLEIGALALDSVVSDSLIRNLELTASSFAKAINHEANENFPRIIQEKTEEFVSSLTSYLDPQMVDSFRNQMELGLAKIKNEISLQISSVLMENKASLDEGLRSLGVIKRAFGKSTNKGLTHQAYVGASLESFAGHDLVSDLSTDGNGALSSSGKGKSGDFRVTLGETLELAMPASFVVEAKDSKISEKEALREIDYNKANRGVDVGILVFASIDQAPTQGRPIKIFPGNRIIVACDHELETALYAAYAYARSLVKNRATNKTLDSGQFARALNEVIDHLDIECTINKEAKAITNSLERLVNSALSARNKVLATLSQFD
jgi:hypothetical protein